MAPWGASVNGTDALIASPTVIDARQGTTGCSNGVTLQGMTLRLGADLVVYADRLSVINGLNIQSLDGKAHELRLLVPTTTGTCTGPTTIAAPNGIQAAANINVHLVTSGRVQINGATALSAQIDAGCLTTTGAVTLTHATLTTKDAM